MAWKHDVDRKIADFLQGNNFTDLSFIDVKIIINQAINHFNLDNINLDISERETTRLYGTATKHSGQKGGGYTIKLFPRGMNVLSVLHELAHCFKDGYDHYVGWTFAFFRLADWFMDNADSMRPKLTVRSDELE